MTVPNPTFQAQGLGSVSDEALNSTVQACTSLAQMRGLVGLGQAMLYLEGLVSVGDGGQGPFTWSANATGPDDGANVIVPNGVTQGAWVRLPIVAPAAGFVPYAAQMTLSADVPWVGQAEPSTFWPPWNQLTTSAAPTPAYNPDNMASLTTPCPVGSPMFQAFGATGPGFTVPVAGVYQVYAYLNLAYAETPGPSPLDDSFEVFIECGKAPWPTNGQVLNSNERPGILATGFKGFFNVNVTGGVTCTGGEVLFVGIDDNSSNNGANLTVSGLSYFGIYRVR